MTLAGTTLFSVASCSPEKNSSVEASQSEKPSKHQHVWSPGVETKAPTHDEEGEMVARCSGCGVTKTTKIPMIEHDFHSNHDETYHWQECSCGFIKEKTEHTFLRCEYDGNRPDYDRCVVCNYIVYDESSLCKKGYHSYGDYIRERDATCQQEGLLIRTCTRCGHDDYMLEPMLWHDLERIKENEIEPTWKTEGSYDLVDVCKNCGTEVDREHFTIAVKEKEEPFYVVPTGITAVYNTRLSEIELPEGFSFANPNGYVGNVGINAFDAFYKAPNDEEEKYRLVELSITVTVIKANYGLETVDLSYLDDLSYTGKEIVGEPEISANYSINYYQNGKKLSSKPKNVGEYTVEISIVDNNYENETITKSFFISREPNPFGKLPAILEAPYGKPFDFESACPSADDFSITITDGFKHYFRKDSVLEEGIYYVTFNADENSNHGSSSRTIQMNVVPDEEAPSINIEHLLKNGIYYVDGDVGTICPVGDDNVGVSYFICETASRDKRSINTKTLKVEAGYEYRCWAIDMSGNYSDMAVFSVLNSNKSDGPRIKYPNGTTIEENYVKLEVDNPTLGVQYFLFDQNGKRISVREQYATCLANGDYTWYAVNNAGVESETATFTVNKSTISDEITVIGPVGDINSGVVYLIASSDCGIARYHYGTPGSQNINTSTTGVLSHFDNSFVECEWYAEDNAGNVSEKCRFRNLCRGDDALRDVFDFTDKHLDTDVIYMRPNSSNTIVIRYNTIEGYDIKNAEVRYHPHDQGVGYVSAGGVLADSISGEDFFEYRVQKDYGFFSVAHVENNSVFDVRFDIDDFYYVYTYIVDSEAPCVGQYVRNGDTIVLSEGTDNQGADYYYSFNNRDWVKYEGNVEFIMLSDDSTLFLSLKAVDYAGNVTVEHHAINQSLETYPESLPVISIVDGIVDKPTNQDVTFRISPVEGQDSYYFLDGQLFDCNQITTVTISEEGDHLLSSAVKINKNLYCSEPVAFVIDKTAPVINNILYIDNEMYGVFNYTHFYALIRELSEEKTGIELYWDRHKNGYELWEVCPSETDRPEMFLFFFFFSYIRVDGNFIYRFRLVDEAGNESDILEIAIPYDLGAPVLDKSASSIVFEYDPITKEFLGARISLVIKDEVSAIHGCEFAWYDESGVMTYDIKVNTCNEGELAFETFVPSSAISVGKNYFQFLSTDEAGYLLERLYEIEITDEDIGPNDTDIIYIFN